MLNYANSFNDLPRFHRDHPESTPNPAKIRTQILTDPEIPDGQDPEGSRNGPDPGIMDLRVATRMAQIRGSPDPGSWDPWGQPNQDNIKDDVGY